MFDWPQPKKSIRERRCLAEQLEQRDREGGGAEAVRDEYAAEVFVEAQLQVLEVGFGREAGGVELFESLGDAFGLRAGKALSFELLDDAVRVNHERLHRRFQCTI